MAKAWAATDIGNVKKQNEDDLLLDEENRVFVVADGVSGRKAGDVASDMITTFFAEHADELRELVDSRRRPRGRHPPRARPAPAHRARPGDQHPRL